MKLSHFFIERPIFGIVLFNCHLIAGGDCLYDLARGAVS